MKKIIAIVMALVMMMAICVPAFAAVTGGSNAGNDTIINTDTKKDTDNDGIGDTEVAWYTVTIPATQEIFWEATTTDIEYKINSQLATGDFVKVTVAGSGLLKKDGSTATLAYAITDTEYTATAEVVVDEADTVTIDTTNAAWATVPVDKYSDTLTFTAEIV